MGLGCNIFYWNKIKSVISKSAYRGITARTYSAYADYNFLHTAFFYFFNNHFRNSSRRKRRCFFGARKTQSAGWRLCQYISFLIRNRNHRIIICRLNMGNPPHKFTARARAFHPAARRWQSSPLRGLTVFIFFSFRNNAFFTHSSFFTSRGASDGKPSKTSWLSLISERRMSFRSFSEGGLHLKLFTIKDLNVIVQKVLSRTCRGLASGTHGFAHISSARAWICFCALTSHRKPPHMAETAIGLKFAKALDICHNIAA
mgnify:CR=1 FL=1